MIKILKELAVDTLRWFKLFLNHFQLFEMDESKQLFHLFYRTKIRTSEIMPAIFFFGKLQTPITCFPFKFSSL